MKSTIKGDCMRLRAAIVVALTALAAAGAQGQVVRGDRIPEALKTIAPAVGACRRTDDPSGLGSPARPVAEPAPLPCTTASSDAVAQQAQRGAVLIDVRPASDYGKFHIAGALNASLSEVQSKPYWRDASVVLIGDGRAEGELLAACGRLRQSGYQQAQVLRGGMAAWLGSGQPVLGNPPTVGQQIRLGAADYLLESRDPGNLLLIDAALSAMRVEMPAATILPDVTPLAIKAALERRRKPNLGRGPTVVVAYPGAVSDDQIAALQRALLPVPLLVFTDGRDAVVRQQKVQKAMWVAADRGPKPLACGL